MAESLGPCMEEELESQPACWEKVLELKDERALAPKKGARVAVVGCGTSWFMAQAYAAMRESAGEGVTDAFTATESRITPERGYDTLVVISRSGTTSEIIHLLKKHRTELHTFAIVGSRETEVGRLAENTVEIPFADEKSVVQTRFATTALTFLRSTIQGEEPCRKAIEDAKKVLAAPLDDALVDAEQYSFIGTDWRLGVATEAALKMRESCQAWTESYSSMEYRHGPIAIAAPGRITWSFGPLPKGLRSQIEATGARLIDEDRDPLADLVAVHRVALATARKRGLNPDHPRNLTRSVILDDSQAGDR